MERFFNEELNRFRSDFVTMADHASRNFSEAIQSLVTGDADKARWVRAADDTIDALEVQIDAEGVRYLTLRAPVATDARLITLALKASHDLERIGDEASSIAKRVLRILDLGGALATDLCHIPEMAKLAVHQVQAAIDSLVNHDADTALGLAQDDKAIDRLHRLNYESCLEKIIESPKKSPVLMELVFISKSIERVGDHAINIAEEVYFLLTGNDVRHTAAVKRTLA